MPEVELYGTSCINPLRHPSDPRNHYSLMTVLGTGCGTLGEDDAYSKIADY